MEPGRNPDSRAPCPSVGLRIFEPRYQCTASQLRIWWLEVTQFWKNLFLNSLSPKLFIVLLFSFLEHHVTLLVLATQSSCAIVGSTFRTFPDQIDEVVHHCMAQGSLFVILPPPGRQLKIRFFHPHQLKIRFFHYHQLKIRFFHYHQLKITFVVSPTEN